jgi:hypothetical protein
VHMTFSYVKVNDQIYFEKFYHLPPLNNYPSNFVFTSSYTWSYRYYFGTIKATLPWHIGLFFLDPFSTCCFQWQYYYKESHWRKSSPRLDKNMCKKSVWCGLPFKDMWTEKSISQYFGLKNSDFINFFFGNKSSKSIPSWLSPAHLTINAYPLGYTTFSMLPSNEL